MLRVGYPTLFAAFLVAGPAAAATSTHVDPVTGVVFGLAILLVAAKLGGDVAVRLGQPAVLGELVVGVVLGNLDLFGLRLFSAIEQDPMIDVLARLGVLLLLFQVGLESTVRDMAKVGVRALAVAVLGVVTPFALGWGVGMLLLPQSSSYVHAFLGATLTATSVGITARVFADLGRQQSEEARVVLGAAVFDDVLGLIILAVMGSVIVAADAGSGVAYGDVALVLVKAVLFLFGGLAVGHFVSPRLFRVASKLKGQGVLLAVALAFCFALAYVAALVELAPIVGAYAAGLVLEDVHFRDFHGKGERQLEELVQPVASFLVPIFFVLMGMHVELGTFARVQVLGLGVALTAAAIVGKQACSFAAIGSRLDALTLGIGMVPRGEVGLIFANIGLGLTVHGERIVDEATFSACVMMVIVTTMITPPALRWSLGRAAKRRARADEHAGEAL
jgi:Kef-type K+ transport system membrane component KefB